MTSTILYPLLSVALGLVAITALWRWGDRRSPATRVLLGLALLGTFVAGVWFVSGLPEWLLVALSLGFCVIAWFLVFRFLADRLRSGALLMGADTGITPEVAVGWMTAGCMILTGLVHIRSAANHEVLRWTNLASAITELSAAAPLLLGHRMVFQVRQRGVFLKGVRYLQWKRIVSYSWSMHQDELTPDAASSARLDARGDDARCLGTHLGSGGSCYRS